MGGECSTKGEGRQMHAELWLGNVKSPLGRRRSKWEDNTCIIINSQEIKWALRLDCSAPGLGHVQA
jgi:hypothetical protein